MCTQSFGVCDSLDWFRHVSFCLRSSAITEAVYFIGCGRPCRPAKSVKWPTKGRKMFTLLLWFVDVIVDYMNDPYSQGGSCNTICCRGDLMAHPSPFGCYDAKVSACVDNDVWCCYPTEQWDNGSGHLTTCLPAQNIFPRDKSKKTIEVTVTKFRTHDDYIEASWQGCDVVSKCPVTRLVSG